MDKKSEARRSSDLTWNRTLGNPRQNRDLISGLLTQIPSWCILWGLSNGFITSLFPLCSQPSVRVYYWMVLHLYVEGLVSPCQSKCTCKECTGLVSLPKKIVSPFSWALIARTAGLEQIRLTICCQIPDYMVDKRSFLGLHLTEYIVRLRISGPRH